MVVLGRNVIARVLAGALGLVALAPGFARADANDSPAPTAAVSSDVAPEQDASGLDRSIAAGALLPLTLSAAVGATPATAVGYAGFDGARGSAVGQAFAEVRLWRQLALRGGSEFSDTSHRLRPTIGARLQILAQQRQGIDGAVSVFYRAEGFDEPEGEVETVVSIGRRFGRTAVVANLAYGQDFDGHERDGELRLAALARVGTRLHLGLDSRWRFDLGSETAKLQASNEPTYDLDAGPVAALAVGPVALVAHAGASVVRRVGRDPAFGLVALAGLGTSF